MDKLWGERYGQVDDPSGRRWSISMRIEMKPEEIEAKLKAAMAMFEQREHPGDKSQPSGVQ